MMLNQKQSRLQLYTDQCMLLMCAYMDTSIGMVY